MKSRYGKMPQKQLHTDDRCCISSTLLLCAAVSSLKHQPRVISGAAGAPCVNTANQTDLCWGVWCLWPNPWPFSECVRLNVRACKRRVCCGSCTPFAERAKDERILIRDTRLEKKKKRMKKSLSLAKKKKQTSFYEAGEQKTAWQGSRRVIKETGWKRQKSQRQDASVPQQLLKGAAFFSRYIAAKLTVLTTLHTQPPCTLELTAFIWWRVSPAHGSKNFSVGNIA